MVSEVHAAEVARRLRTPTERVLLLDVREPYERAQAVIQPSTHMPMQEVPDRLAELPRDRPIIVYCHTGVRSAMVAGYLEQNGFSHISNLAGGIDAWSREVDPAVPRYL